MPTSARTATTCRRSATGVGRAPPLPPTRRAASAGARRASRPARPGEAEPMRILVLNTGSSSLKWSLLDAGSERLEDHGEASWSDPDPERHSGELRAALEPIPAVDAVGHRVVHGGSRFREAVLVGAEVREA